MAKVIKEQTIITDNGAEAVYYGVDNPKYITTDEGNLAVTLANINTRFNTLESILNNEDDGLIKIKNNLTNRVAELEKAAEEPII